MGAYDDERLARIETMLRALLGDKATAWIGGYVYGETSREDTYILLYGVSERLVEKVCRVYPQHFKLLPAFIPTENVQGKTDSNPNKEVARRKGIYHECPPFEIVTTLGKETQMGPERRFGGVLRLSKAAREALSGRPAAPPPPPPPPVSRPVEKGDLPDYSAMACAATTEQEFDYAAYMALRDESLYTDQDRIGRVRGLIAPDWTCVGSRNEALLHALRAYRDERARLESDGTESSDAHRAAKSLASETYTDALLNQG